MFDVIYYFFYRIYNRLPKDVDPHTSASLALGSCIALFITGIMDIISLKFFCLDMGVWPFFIIFIIIGFMSYWHYEIKEHGKEIMLSRPLYFNSKPLSIIITLLFFLITVSSLFWVPIYGKHLTENCQNSGILKKLFFFKKNMIYILP